MKDIFLVNYSVKGIKTLDKLISLSFYKKIVTKELDMQEYNIKGIYGMNGSGKSGIVTSVEILRNLLVDSSYLNNPIAQKNLDAIINKKLGKLFIESDYIVKSENKISLFRYSVTLTKDITGKYAISHEKLSVRNALSKSESMNIVFEVSKGEIVFLSGNEDSFSKILLIKTMNLLPMSSMCALFYEKVLLSELKDNEIQDKSLFANLCGLYVFGRKLYVYLDESDNHRGYVAQNALECSADEEKRLDEVHSLVINLMQMDNHCLNVITAVGNIVSKNNYPKFEKIVDKLYEFIHIFKADLQGIGIDKKENHDLWVCDLVMNYGDYKIHAEYESTGIKKLIQLFAYLKEMAQGGIVFIDEFDSNLHDVYLCALLEYLMEYGEGQLCFTTHNVGPMDVLKRRKKSIDFLSEDHNIYSWTKCGHYSPSNLYRNGMIEGSPFNVDSLDFIGVFSTDEEDE